MLRAAVGAGDELQCQRAVSRRSCDTASISTPRRPSVWSAITDPECIKQWMLDSELEIVSDWQVHSAIVFRGELNGHRFENRGTIRAFEPPKIFAYDYWSTLSQGQVPEGPENTTWIRFELEATVGGTKVTVTLANFADEIHLPAREVLLERHSSRAQAVLRRAGRDSNPVSLTSRPLVPRWRLPGPGRTRGGRRSRRPKGMALHRTTRRRQARGRLCARSSRKLPL